MMNQPDNSLDQTATMPRPMGQPLQQQRHPWRVDLKWVFAIPFTIMLVMTLVVLTMFQATGKSNAESTISASMQPLLSDPQFRAELSQMDPEVLLWLESPAFASAVYEDPDEFKNRIDSLPESPGGEGEGLVGVLSFLSGPISLFSSPVHTGFVGVLIGFSILSLIFGSLTVTFSRRLGRLVTPGICLALASWLTLPVVYGLREAVSSSISSDSDGPEEQILTDSLAAMAEGVLDQAVSVYGLFAFISILLLIGAGIAALVMRLRD